MPGPRARRTAPGEGERAADARAAVLRARAAEVRQATAALAARLTPEDAMLQSMPDASPAKWHLGHTTWFFETFVLARAERAHRPFDPAYGYLFNSYYEALGPRQPRPERGLLSRPPLEEVLRYRAEVDERLDAALARVRDPALLDVVELGVAHEEQHQELLLTDLKHAFSASPLRPAYAPGPPPPASGPAPRLGWLGHAGGRVELGADADGFAFDHERPRHAALVPPHALATRPVTCGEWLEFIDAGGYRRPDLWMSEGWDAVHRHGWTAPLHWIPDGDGWRLFTLGGVRPLDPAEAVAHVSWYEADAYARFAGARLPTEAEWEAHAEACEGGDGTFLEDGRLHPAAATPGRGARQLLGDVWEWTASAYGPYPGYRPAAGALGEYNGKFMVGQQVLRGGSCASPRSHLRASYRNFFHPDARWQFTGVRLARDL